MEGGNIQLRLGQKLQIFAPEILQHRKKRIQNGARIKNTPVPALKINARFSEKQVSTFFVEIQNDEKKSNSTKR